ncbi:MAG: hypothetical protein HC772_06055 [Leptolyngbyaceae cyanobacterium CRU_2_3]|nr:hypothetical protein [Leptolyngbyaceae cyanobacterium CRU_2_3]
MEKALLQNRDYTVIIAKTAVDQGAKPPGFAERWIAAQSTILKLVQACESFDPDGVTLYLACQSPQEDCIFKKYEHVKSLELTHLIESNFPPEKVYLLEVLKTALDDYFFRKTSGVTKPNGEIILVLIDGEPSDRMAVAKAIRAATHRLDTDEELGIGFVQIGEDMIAQGYLTALDNYLKEAGAKFDIVDTKLLDAIQPDTLTEFLMGVLED